MIPNGLNGNNGIFSQSATNGSSSSRFDGRGVTQSVGSDREKLLDNPMIVTITSLLNRTSNCMKKYDKDSILAAYLLNDFLHIAPNLVIYKSKNPQEDDINSFFTSVNILSNLASKGLLTNLSSGRLNPILENLSYTYKTTPPSSPHNKLIQSSIIDVLKVFDTAGLLRKVTDVNLIRWLSNMGYNIEIARGKGIESVLSFDDIYGMISLLQKREVNCVQRGIPTDQDILADFEKQAPDLLIYDKGLDEPESIICGTAKMLSILAGKGLLANLSPDRLNAILGNLSHTYETIPPSSPHIELIQSSIRDVLAVFYRAGLLMKVTDGNLISWLVNMGYCSS